jgi:hypothetical protein
MISAAAMPDTVQKSLDALIYYELAAIDYTTDLFSPNTSEFAT